ncbi:RES family NAD+ phosphorylase [Rhodopirellula sallentina]|uniref:RES domain protein n=1 Tax=Rhodopirellula sallentina SM41 TaxID=1263870 RepID=M5UJ03_9BACT|nr:RES family NAD+ phosphorylase [Rhodopirellula sallentina]EMI56013.1 RES domain protein [Rhodopirellula sallentina SM41]
MEFESMFGLCCYGRFEWAIRQGVVDKHTTGFLNAVAATVESRIFTMKPRGELFRAVRGCERPNADGIYVQSHPSGRLKPNGEVGEGRANRKGDPVLYAADAVGIAVRELRPWFGEEISIAEFTTNDPLKLVDLATPRGVSLTFDLLARQHDHRDKRVTPAQFHAAAWDDIARAFSTPVSTRIDGDGYLATQRLAAHFQSLGFDGIRYRSSTIIDDSEANSAGFNYAIFNFENMQPVDSWVVEVKRLNVECTPAPCQYFDGHKSQ